MSDPCPKCGSPAREAANSIHQSWECGSWRKADGTESHTLTCHQIKHNNAQMPPLGIPSSGAVLSIHIDAYRALPIRTRQLVQMYHGGPLFPDRHGILTIVVSKDRAVEIAKELGIAPKAIGSNP